jgi:hypothetical protein
MSDRKALRRYLLHRSIDDERDAIEQEYFGDEAGLDAAAAEEDALIDDYLTHRLSAGDRVQFERVYGSNPDRRVRVQLSRALNAAASSGSHIPVGSRRWLYGSLAAAALVLFAVTVWVGQQPTPRPAADNAASSSTPPAVSIPAPQPDTTPQNPAARVVAVTLSPIVVRSVDETSSVILPPGVDLVSLTLEGVGQSASTTGVRAVVRTVEGREVWGGDAVSTAVAASQARFEIPANLLPPDDYIVTVYGLAGGQERELQRYSLRVRAR